MWSPRTTPRAPASPAAQASTARALSCLRVRPCRGPSTPWARPGLVPFTWTNLTTAQQAYFMTPYIDYVSSTQGLTQFCASGSQCLSATAQTSASGQALVDFLRGDRTNEGAYFRSSQARAGRHRFVRSAIRQEAAAELRRQWIRRIQGCKSQPGRDGLCWQQRRHAARVRRRHRQGELGLHSRLGTPRNLSARRCRLLVQTPFLRRRHAGSRGYLPLCPLQHLFGNRMAHHPRGRFE